MLTSLLASGPLQPWMLYALVAVLYVVEWWLPRTNKVAARSTLELIANVLQLIPGVGAMFSKLATPPAPSSTLTAIDKDSSNPPPLPPSAASMLVIVFLTFGVSSCALGNKVVKVTVQCGTPEVEKLVASITPEIVTALATANFAPLLDELIATLTGQGVKDALGVVTCAIQNLAGNARTMSNPRMLTVRSNASSWLASHKTGTLTIGTVKK